MLCKIHVAKRQAQNRACIIHCYLMLFAIRQCNGWILSYKV